MHLFSLDTLIVVISLLATLIIGLRAGRGIQDIREYATADKTFGTGALTLSLLATAIGGAMVLGGTGRVFSEGIIYTVSMLGIPFNLAIIAFLIAPRMGRFSHCLTLGDVMRELYGHSSALLAGVLGFLVVFASLAWS